MEATNNVLKHAVPRSPCSILVGVEGGGVDVAFVNQVADAARTTGGRVGLIGMAERLRACGGTLHTERRGSRWGRGEVRTTFGLQLAGLGLTVGAGAAVLGLGLRLALQAMGALTVFGLPLRLPWNVETLLWVVGPALACTALFAAAGLPHVERLARVPADDVLRDGGV